MTENTNTSAPLTAPPAVPGYFQTPPPAPKKRPWYKQRIVLIPAAAMLVGLGMGAATTPEPKTVEVIKEVPGPERTVTKEVKVNVPTTPASCLEALDLNEQAFTGLAESLRLVTERDYSGAKANNDKVARLVPKVNAAKVSCRAAQ